MTPRRAKSLFAPRPAAILMAMGLALAWAAEARAGCAGRDHRLADAKAAAAGLSAEIVGEPAAAPLKPGGCTGAFCSRPKGPDGMDFSGGVDLRADSWACCATPDAPVAAGRGRLLARSDAPRPSRRRDVLIDPPR